MYAKLCRSSESCTTWSRITASCRATGSGGARGSFHALQVDGQSCESLIEVVMQFARDPPALLFLGLDQLHRQRFQFVPLFTKQENMLF